MTDVRLMAGQIKDENSFEKIEESVNTYICNIICDKCHKGYLIADPNDSMYDTEGKYGIKHVCNNSECNNTVYISDIFNKITYHNKQQEHSEDINLNLTDSLDDFGSVLICAIRYCLGRRTYMPEVVTNFIKYNCKNILSKKDISIISSDIESCRDYGDSCDKETWMNFLSWLKEEYKNR